MIDLRGAVVVVTGARGAIGSVIARRFAEQGAIVAGLDLAATDTGAVPIRACDVSDPEQARAAINAVVAEHGRLDVLVNNAGINVTGAVEDLDPGAWDQCFAVNTRGVFVMCQAAIATMKSQRSGRIINAASFAATIPSVGAAAYAASKAAVVQFTRVLAGELGPWNVTANCYAPGMIPSAMNGFAALPAAEQEELLDTLTLRRWGTAEEVADAVCYLASDLARYTTGTVLDVSGGKFATQRPQAAYRAVGEREEC
ncbi:SDR family oxidoreductase [Bogoriella caseilytica]|uniref:3-oxoacyl-[acyl-carrier protein] reductase n=1 Tax=Bogoriella caseilytica TaxID=56055 RepID=A0A3N2BEM9_9MICO|nr:SDR family NAD(P)-dependent oxidoreductase [Bogoriella caseilytica]ROR73675.1 3-oxoacyl-[acyl-carrier protein] reductase [Bogoriella caseilytica]